MVLTSFDFAADWIFCRIVYSAAFSTRTILSCAAVFNALVPVKRSGEFAVELNVAQIIRRSLPPRLHRGQSSFAVLDCLLSSAKRLASRENAAPAGINAACVMMAEIG